MVSRTQFNQGMLIADILIIILLLLLIPSARFEGIAIQIASKSKNRRARPFPLCRFAAFRFSPGVAAFFIFHFSFFISPAATLTLTSSADTTMIQVAPTNSNGGQSFFNAGTTQNGTLNRGLIRFDLGALPASAHITSASVVLTVVKVPAEPGATAPFSLHRVLKNWGEGTNVGVQNIGQGSPAKLGDATWTHAHFNTNAWASDGGLPGTDFFDFGSASVSVDATVPAVYTFGPTTELADDARGWLANPAANFGWMLVCDEEGTIFTARRFGARENPVPDYRPQLILNYIVAPVITRAELSGGNFLLGFQAAAGQGYTLEYRDAIGGGSWQPLVDLGYFPASTPVTILEPRAQPARFYRLNTY